MNRNENKRTMRNAAVVLLVTLVFLLLAVPLTMLALTMPRGAATYSCRTMDFHPDVTPAMRKQCRELVRGSKL